MSSVACVEAFVALATQQLSKSVAFYQTVLGFEPQVWVPESYAEFRLPGLKLAIFQPRSDGVREFSESSGCAMSLCLEVDDLAGAIAHLTRLGFAPPGEIIFASHGQEIYAYDPDSNRLILHESSAD